MVDFIKSDLEDLCIDLERLLAEEKRLSAIRIDKQNQIVKLVSTKLEGTDSVQSPSYKVTVSNKLTRKLNYQEYLKVEGEMPISCVDMKPVLDLRKVRMLEELDGSFTSTFITTKPAKAAVKIERKPQE